MSVKLGQVDSIKFFRNLQIGCKKNQLFFLNCELFILIVY